ncbi:MAG: cytidylate kinase-like family protein [Deltaproteobacteria bacterium]|nr:cytidylate kinase-like family protein [Deltaproteobacteria bacterium]
MSVITFSKEYASGGLEIAKALAKKLGYEYVDKEIVRQVADHAKVSHQEVLDFEEEGHINIRAHLSRIIDLDIFKKSHKHPEAETEELETSYDERDKIPYSFDTQGWIDSDIYREMICKVISDLGRQPNVIIVGRGGQCILKEQAGVINIRIIAAMADRIARLQVENPDLSDSQAQKQIEAMDKKSREYIKFYFNEDWKDPKLYDAVINTSRLSDERVVEWLGTLCR